MLLSADNIQEIDCDVHVHFLSFVRVHVRIFVHVPVRFLLYAHVYVH
jgi:hypothetical protein